LEPLLRLSALLALSGAKVAPKSPGSNRNISPTACQSDTI
jgi:hypothetical protein